MPESKVDFDSDTNVQLSVDVPRSDREEITAKTADVTNGNDENNIAENDEELETAEDVQNVIDVDDVEVDATIRRLQRLARHLSSQVIQLKPQFLYKYKYTFVKRGLKTCPGALTECQNARLNSRLIYEAF